MAVDPARIAEQFALDAEMFLAVFIDDKPRSALAQFRVNVLRWKSPSGEARIWPARVIAQVAALD